MDSQVDSQVADVAFPKAESQGDSQMADVAVPKAASQGDFPVDDVAVPAEAEMAIQKAITSRMARLGDPANDWNNRMRELTMELSSKIPYVGQVASIILGIFWPVNNVDIFESIKPDIENLVDLKILAKEMEERQHEIDALHEVIKEYQSAQTIERRSWLNRWIADSILLNLKLQESSNNVQFILQTITLALLHLSGLRERLSFGMEIYAEDNRVVWKQDLEKAYHDYVVVYFPDIFKKWKMWRADQVVINTWLTHHVVTYSPYEPESHATVEDLVSGAKQEYYKDSSSSLSIFDWITNDHKTKMCNDAYTEMAGCLSTTFEFDKIVPNTQDPPYDKELFGSMFLGPYAEELLLGPEVHGEPRYPRKLTDDDYDVNKGSLKKMVIREWNSIDAMQFIYANGSGTLAGNPDGGQEQSLNVIDKNVNGLRMGFAYGILCFVQVLFRDGTKSDTYGNHDGWPTNDGVANGPPGYKLRSWSYNVNWGPSDTWGPGTLQLQYEVQL